MEIDRFVSYLCFKIAKKLKKKVPKSGEPQSFKQILQLPKNEQKLWLNAIKSKYGQLLSSGTLQFLPKSKLPKGRKLLSNRLVLKLKKEPKKLTKYKARLVVRGFMQIEGLDFTETFAATSIPPTWRILLAFAAALNQEIKQIDFIGAFLNGDLNMDIYMEIPEGFADILAKDKAMLKLAIKFGYDPFNP